MAQLPTFHESEQSVGIVGDWHGNDRWAISVLNALMRLNIHTVLQLGDFGVWPGEGGERYLNDLQDVLEKNEQTLYVTLGNHEDYTQVEACPKDAAGIAWIRPAIALLPRPFRFEIKLTTFLSLGGAPSVDRWHRKPYISWWPQEMITKEQADEAAAGGPVDVMLAHDAPNGGTHAVSQIISSGGGWSAESLQYAAEGRMLMDRVVYEVKPRAFFHGHYHVEDSGYLRYDNNKRGEIHAMSLDGEDGNVGVLHIDEDFLFERFGWHQV